jgi:predicted phage baseplate assembly protein
MSAENPTLDTCGCCQGLQPLMPAVIENSPGLSAIAYRVGTHGSFKETMLAGISREPALAALSARDDNDPAVALMDAWAAVLDVLTFYEERIANEGYLRTATELRSVLELANTIGYRRNPGVAAGTYLAFSLESAPGGADSAVIDIGVKAQSLPKQNQLPQTFETVESITAYRDWNAIKARSTHLLAPVAGQTVFYLQGATTELKKGDPVLIIGDERIANPANNNWDFRRVLSVSTDSINQWTIVTLDRGIGSPFAQPARKNAKFYALRQRAALFGYSAPDWRAMSDNVKDGYLGLPSNTPVDPSLAQWPGFRLSDISDPPPGTAPGSGLEGRYFNDSAFGKLIFTRTDHRVDFDFGSGTPDPAVTSLVYSIRWDGWVSAPTSGLYTFYTLSPNAVRLWVNNLLLINSWISPNPAEQSADINLRAGLKYDIKVEFLHTTGEASIQLSWAGAGIAKQLIPSANLYPRDVYTVHLDAAYPKILAQPDSWLILESPSYVEVYRVDGAASDSRTNFTLTAKTTQLTLSGQDLKEQFDNLVRETVAFGQSEYLPFAAQPITQPVSGNSIALATDPGDMPSGRTLLISGTSALDGSSVSELAVLDQVETLAGIRFLHLRANLQYSYVPASVVINANLAQATHGETKTEILGSASGSAAFQQFTLKQMPLTYVSAATTSGSSSTLEVRVNGLLWEEVPTLLRAGSGDRVYITRMSEKGEVTVQFGDGITGSRPPSGTSNVVAKYRVGTGLAGMLDAGQISLLMSKPLGLKSVVNPFAPSGAGDPEALSHARENAPLTVLTLDRIVSLEDYEDFTGAFAGIGKAKAAWLWEDDHTVVHITVASAAGGPVEDTSALMMHLKTAIDRARDPAPKVHVASFDPLTFAVQAEVLVDSPAFVAADVLAAVSAAVANAYSFAQREFAQPVTASEAIALMQTVPGVVAVWLKQLHLVGASGNNAMLVAKPARWETDATGKRVIKPAQLLTTSPNEIQISEMTRP